MAVACAGAGSGDRSVLRTETFFRSCGRREDTQRADGFNGATALFGLGRAAEARPPAAAGHGDCPEAFGADHPRTTHARSLLDRIGGA
ncbi:hypothetical protein ACFY15_24680 [Streptomyces sp. NPDC001373]|uniref:hypothetical protein n=1 Tax=Streptomyces sp. NPDC001373 TaxID=3364565 RepID=UPI0036C8A088